MEQNFSFNNNNNNENNNNENNNNENNNNENYSMDICNSESNKNSNESKHTKTKNISKEEKISKIYIYNLIQHNKSKIKSPFSPTSSEIPTTSDFFSSSSQNLIEIYGPEIYTFSLTLENSFFYPNFLTKHNNINNIYRTRIINWMLEIFSNYKSEPLSFYTSVSLFDKFLLKSERIINDFELQLIAMACIFISSKMEDIIPLHIIHIKKNIGHNLYNENEIVQTEIEILQTLNFDVFCVTTYHFIKTFLYDFVINNKIRIKNLNLEKYIISLENICLYLNKVILINEKFLKYKCSLIAISIIVMSFDILRSNSLTLGKEKENFLKQWIIFLIKESEYKNHIINHIYQKIMNYLNEVDSFLINAPKIKEERNKIVYY